MDYNLTDEQKGKKREYEAFFAEEMKNAPPGFGDMSNEGIYDSDEGWAFTRYMAKKLAEKGWLTMAWPKEYGGLDASITDQVILSDVMTDFGAPGIDAFGVKMFAPTLMLYANEEQKKRLLPPIARAEVVYCQGWSEPDAGSDLATVKTMAVREGDDYIINGQKLWTTGGHRADHMFCLARTDPDTKRSKGLSVFNIDMSDPGIEVRPIKYLDGSHIYNEVFLKDVRVPVEDRIGPEGEGWASTRATMNFERSGSAAFLSLKKEIKSLMAYLKTTKRGGKLLSDDPALKRKIAKIYAEAEAGSALSQRIAWNQETKGLAIAPHLASESKVYASEVRQRFYNIGLEAMGLFGQLHTSKWSPVKGKMLGGFHHVLVATISAGTSEIQRNIIAWSGAELPRFR
jgi:3-oxocholest-4-en-26-oyl-CoA dehydrogenase alpha subunit